jgi:hypothetical protein
LNSKSSALKLRADVKWPVKIVVLSYLLRQFGEEQIRRERYVNERGRNVCNNFMPTFMVTYRKL